MKTLARYSIICCSVFSLLIIITIYEYFIENTSSAQSDCDNFHQKSEDPTPKIVPIGPVEDVSECTISSCMAFANCEKLTVTVKNVSRSAKFLSTPFKKLVHAFRNLPFYIDSPNDDLIGKTQACFTMINVDVLDRDILSPTTLAVVPDFQTVLDFMRLHPETNYLFLNLFSGTYPDYSEKVDFEVGKAILLKSSVSYKTLRFGYDVAFPLVNMWKIDVLPKPVINFRTSTKDHYLATFKGKRYVQGIGSETRDLLPLISNQKDVVSLVTCEHNRDEWKKQLNSIEMQQCEVSIREYHRPEYDYETLLLNSTFCFVPRGRRLDSFRLLEVMRASCIPVILSNNLVLPFSEVIQWNRLAIISDERILTPLPSYLRNVPAERVMEMKQQVSFIYTTYFSSLDSILRTTLKLLHGRMSVGAATLPKWMWNSYPGALFVDMLYSSDPTHFPFWGQGHDLTTDRFTVAVVQQPNEDDASCLQILSTLSAGRKIKQVVFASLRSESSTLSEDAFQPQVQFKTIRSPFDVDTIVSKDSPFVMLFNCSEDVTRIHQKVEMLMGVSAEYRDRLVGFDLMNHFLSSAIANLYTVSHDVSDYFSIVNISSSVHHKYYYYLLKTYFNRTVTDQIRQKPECVSVFLNMLVAHVTQKPPIGLRLRSEHPENGTPSQTISEQTAREDDSSEENRLSLCVQWFRSVLGYIPLRHSNAVVTAI